MSSGDEEALSWEGDDDATPPRAPRRGAARGSAAPHEGGADAPPPGWRAVGRGSERIAGGDEAADAGDPDAAGADARDVPGAGALDASPAERRDERPAGGREERPASMGNAALVAFGVLAGVYALYTVGWLLGGLRLRDRIEGSTGAVADVMFQGALWLGVLAPAIWFLTTAYVTRGGPAWRRFAGLALGVVLLVPWPFVMVGVVGR